MCRQQVARAIEECGTVARETHQPRRALDQAAAEALLELLQLEAHRRLGRTRCFGGAREARQVGDQHEGLHGVEIQWAHHDFESITNCHHCYH